MAEVDTSIYPKAQPPANPLAMLGQFAGAQNALNTNRLFQSEFAARTGLGQAAQGATDPVTGDLDRGAYLRAVTSNPDTAFLAPQASQQALENERAQIANQSAKNALALKHLTVTNAVIGGLLANPDTGPKDVSDAIARLVAFSADPKHPEGGSLLTAQQGAKTLADMPQDQAQLRQWLVNHYAQNDALAGKLADSLPKPSFLNLGDRSVGVDTSTLTNPGIVGTTATMGLTPEQQVGTAELGVNKLGAPEIGTKAQQLNKLRVGIPQGSITPGIPVRQQALPGNMTTGNALGPAEPPPAPSAAAMPATRPARPAAGPGAAAVAEGGGGVKGLPTALAPTEAASNAADVAQYKSDQATVPVHARNVQSLEKALEALKHSDQGRSTEATHAMYSFLNAQGAITPGLADDVKNYDLFKKYTTEFASRAAAAGGNTDLARTLSEAANAGPGISHAANMEVLKTNIGREKQEIAQVQEHNDPTGVGYGAHKSKFTTATDPRAFAWEHYSPAERDKIEKSLKPGSTEEANFYRSLAIAKRRGLINGQ